MNPHINSLIRGSAAYPTGYSSITEIDGKHSEALLDFGILVLDAGERFSDRNDERERAYLLIDGAAELCHQGGRVEAVRRSVLDEGPWTLHVSAGEEIEILAASRCELAVEMVRNDARFDPIVYSPTDSRSERFGAGTMQETSTRTVRTVFDASTHPDSGMVLGEVINHPGKWSSYPPHSHAHPEIYHYRLFPEQGFGFSQVGDNVHHITTGDTVVIPGGVPHPQVAGPGYVMYYLWMIPHLPGNRFGPDSRIFDEQHTWMTTPDAAIWPDR